MSSPARATIVEEIRVDVPVSLQQVLPLPVSTQVGLDPRSQLERLLQTGHQGWTRAGEHVFEKAVNGVRLTLDAQTLTFSNSIAETLHNVTQSAAESVRQQELARLRQEMRTAQPVIQQELHLLLGRAYAEAFKQRALTGMTSLGRPVGDIRETVTTNAIQVSVVFERIAV
jgi:hypothetical protein